MSAWLSATVGLNVNLVEPMTRQGTKNELNVNLVEREPMQIQLCWTHETPSTDTKVELNVNLVETPRINLFETPSPGTKAELNVNLVETPRY